MAFSKSGSKIKVVSAKTSSFQVETFSSFTFEATTTVPRGDGSGTLAGSCAGASRPAGGYVGSSARPAPSAAGRAAAAATAAALAVSSTAAPPVDSVRGRLSFYQDRWRLITNVFTKILKPVPK